MRKVVGLLLLGGLAFYLVTVGMGLFSAESRSRLDSVGASIIASSPTESGAANTVTAVVLQYRGLDTLGEVTVLLVSAIGVALLSVSLRDGLLTNLFTDNGGFVLQAGSMVLLPFILLVGVYIVAHGHLSPGGGFPGGVIVATAVFVVIMTSKTLKIPQGFFGALEALAGLSFVAVGVIGLYGPARSFLSNFLSKGRFDTLFSAGFLPVIYAVVGIKVASEIITIITKLTGVGDEAQEGVK